MKIKLTLNLLTFLIYQIEGNESADYTFCWQVYGVTSILIHLLMGMQTGTTILEDNFAMPNKISGLPRWLSGKESSCQCRRHGYDP